MAEAGRLKMPAALSSRVPPVTRVRIAIVVATLLLWEAIARSGLLYQDVVPSPFAIGGAVVKLLGTPDFYGNLWVTAGEAATGLAIGGVAGLAVGLVLGANRLLAKAFEKAYPADSGSSICSRGVDPAWLA
jgi:ABC-type nitrate/sulfonate/bicarbonate transport system permease component